MKKLFNLLLVSTAVLAVAACQREQQVTETAEEGVKEVTTQFVLNIASAPTTKQTADVVQLNQNFRGIQDVYLYTYKSGVTEGTPFVSTSSTMEKAFDFKNLLSDGSLNNTDGNNASGETATASKRVLQLSIPLGVDAVTFYGKATKTDGMSSAEYGATNDTETTISGTPSSTVIAAQKILTDGTVVNNYDATARLMITCINDILSTSINAYDHPTFGTLPAVKWSQYGHRYEADHVTTSRYGKTAEDIASELVLDHELEGLEEVLGKCYYMFTYILPASTDRPRGEYRGGSSASIKTMVIDMYKVISAASTATPTNVAEATAQRLAGAIIDRATIYFNRDKDDTVPDGNYEDISTIKSRLVSTYNLYTEEEWTTQFSGAQDLNGYPFEDFGVPEGAAQLGFHYQGEGGTYTKDEFYYHHPNYPLVNPTMTEFEPRKYLYPAELWYYVNSPIRTTSSDVTIASYPDGVTPWNTASSWTDWTYPGKVEGGTRGVAVVNSINYGVAMLKSTVIFKDGVANLQDNRYNLTNPQEPNKVIPISSTLFELRGVLVGGVNPRMNWQFLRKETSGDYSKFDGVIYDHSLSSATVPTPADKPNYTLVYDNYNSSEVQANQNDVYVALEFVNKGEAFYGRDNLIPSGGVFYLVALLPKPTSDQISGLASKWPTDHQIPPLDASGESQKIARVFIQDFMTSVTFKIGENSLQKAYYSVPDLRASQMSLGLSVDLQWISGLEYTVDL